MTPDTLPALVVGAGPAGLAASAELSRRGVRHLVLERGDDVAHSWANLYDSLTLHTGRHLSRLPGMRFPRGTPLVPTRAHFVEYLREYARRHAVPVETRAEATEVERDDGASAWLVRTPAGVLRARHLIWATGIIANPRIVALEGRERFRGRVMHSIEYRRPTGFAGRRVLVVGVGNSGGEIGSELARAGARVTMAVRSGANVVPRELGGIPIQYLVFAMSRLPASFRRGVAEGVRAMSERRRGPAVLPRPSHGTLDSIPLIGFHLVDAIREGLVVVRPGIATLTETGARFTDGSEESFDDVILATGFTAAIAPLRDLITMDPRGFARRVDRVASADRDALWFVGHNYDTRGGIYNIGVDARDVGRRVASR
jgi:hypothetical protein